MWPRAAVAAGLAIAVLAGVGYLLAPSWERPGVATSDDRLPGWSPRSGPAGSTGPLGHTRHEVTVAGTTLGATVISPPEAGPHPALVFVHGGGAGTREAYLEQAERMARLGVVSLVYDKRTDGYTFLQRDYDTLADDALAMVDTVRSHPDVDPDRVGLWGISEGGWVVPLAAARSSAIAYVVLVAAPTMSPGEQLSWAVDEGLRRQDAPAGARRLISRALALGEAGYARHDPLPALRGMHQPVLAYYPTQDRAVPPAQSARILADTLDAAGNGTFTIRFLDGADHAVRVDGALAPGYLTSMASWVHGLPDLPEPRVAGAQPIQHYQAVSQPAGPATAPVIAGLLGLIAVGYLAGPVAGLAARWRGRPGAAVEPRLRRRLRWMAVSGVGTVVGLNLAIGALVTVSVAGGPAALAPAVWLALRLGAVATVGLAGVAGVCLVDAWRGGWRPAGGAERVALVGLCGATLLVLLLASYWELFAVHW